MMFTFTKYVAGK